MVPLTSYLALGAILFCVGLYGVLTKRNLVIVLVSIELMLNAVNINLVAFSSIGPAANVTGQVFTLFTITVAAAEAAVGLAILIALFRNRGTVDSLRQNLMKW
ncbi:NADH-quinone oxidoreductase subunit K [Desulfuribacillus stibiiarsenatis]|uniref:NADH-quinone oxidoreductase subunit K n=1 Tax=Desulfuribacillus stibiiarsenatis TaxID=1390249 RepID=A0A1E5L636_9FIRM|nr:NADH-quinone oxidoreductase subunit NuoK [Desulfuribacillus stibiiarsenatis]OEH85449.1 NADH-quinone oxidoreductase subunit K [Desulfuribacillus stibiiarsenatis]